jgi:hypothetical protein
VPPDSIRQSSRKLAWRLLVAAYGLSLIAIVLLRASSTLSNDSERWFRPRTLDAVLTLESIARAAYDAGQFLNGVAIALMISSLFVFSIRWPRRGEFPDSQSGHRGLGDRVDELVTSLNAVKLDVHRTAAAAAAAEAEHRENTELLSLSRRQANAIRSELRSETSSANRMQAVYFILGVAVSVVLSVIGLWLAR